MSLIGETSRTTLTTPGGTAYAKVIVTNPVNADVYWCYVPAVPATPAVVMLAAHGATGNQNYIETYAPNAIPLAIDRGWIIVCPRGIPSGWGNDASLGYYTAAQTWATVNFGPHIALLHGGSMGGLTVALLAANDSISNLAAWASFDGALSLSYAYGKVAYQPAIATAYGIPPAIYADATAGHDAILRPAGDYAGQSILLVHSTGDTSIEKVYNSDPMFDLIDGVADVTYLTTSGSHSTVNTGFTPVEADAFFAAAVALAPDPNPASTRRGASAAVFL